MNSSLSKVVRFWCIAFHARMPNLPTLSLTTGARREIFIFTNEALLIECSNEASQMKKSTKGRGERPLDEHIRNHWGVKKRWNVYLSTFQTQKYGKWTSLVFLTYRILKHSVFTFFLLQQNLPINFDIKPQSFWV